MDHFQQIYEIADSLICFSNLELDTSSNFIKQPRNSGLQGGNKRRVKKKIARNKKTKRNKTKCNFKAPVIQLMKNYTSTKIASYNKQTSIFRLGF